MRHDYTIKMLWQMKRHFVAHPDERVIVNEDHTGLQVVMNGAAFHRWFIGCLHRKINRKGGLSEPKKAGWYYQMLLVQDKRTLADIACRIRHYQFNTRVCRERLGHLLSSRLEVAT